MYSNILVPIAFDDSGKAHPAIDVARTLAAPGAKITFLHVMERVPPYAVSYLPSDYLALTRDSIQADLDKLAAEVSNGEGVVITGHSGRSILDWAEDNPVDLIVIASHRPGMQDLLLGSTAAKVVRHAQCAVHVIR